MDIINSLPVGTIAEEVNRSLRDHPRLIVTAPPGSGKSTLLPLTILDGFVKEGKILMLEPRRLAARQVACRMADLLGEEVGETVGYRIRFESRVSPRTRIEVVTEGVLTKRLIDDPALEGVSAVLFDEFHERSLQSDTALAIVREIQAVLREDLRIVILSATLDTESLRDALVAPVLSCGGRMFPVEIRRFPEEADPRNVAEVTARAILMACREEEGDILAFLPGEGEIRRCMDLLSESLGSGISVHPLYGMLPFARQLEAMAPSRDGCRKVVLATPVAETSLTIEGVRIIIDSGLCRRPSFHPGTGLVRMDTVRISTDMAAQRAGRAGRLAPGICYRLWSAGTEMRMAPCRKPEILEADFAPTRLEIAAWGESRPERLPWLTPPSQESLYQSKDLLINLEAIDSKGNITDVGKRLAAFPCHPRLAKMLSSAISPDEKSLAADLAAILEERDPMYGQVQSRLDLRLDALRRGNADGWQRIRQVADQYRRMIRAEKSGAPADPFEIGALVARAYPERIGHSWKAAPGEFQLSGGQIVALPSGDDLSGMEWIVASSLSLREEGVGKVFLAAPVDLSDLKPFMKRRELCYWDSAKGEACACRETRIGAILVRSESLSGPGISDRLADAIAEAATKGGLSMFSFSEKVRNLQVRIATVAAWHPELDLPDVSTDALLQSAKEWVPQFAGSMRTAADLRKIDVCEVIRSILTYPQWQAVERIAPSHLTVPTGSRIPVEYRPGVGQPVLRVRLQECFSLTDTPRVDEGKRPVLMELLSPGFKPVQTTSDLRSFWSGTYFEVRKELKRRYPKHAWPDSPLEAEPIRGAVKKKA